MMKAAVWKGVAKIDIELVPIPRPRQPSDVTVRVLGCGICVADTYILRGAVPLAKPPVVLGHEILAEVHELGADVDHLRVGQTVCVDPMVTCGSCSFCNHGTPNLCGRMRSIGFRQDGGFQQFAAVPARHVHPIRTSDRKAGVLAQPLACVLHGYDRLELQAGSDVMILGAGSTGLLWTQVMKRSTQAKLIQTETVASRRNIAVRLGADHAFDPTRGNLAGSVREIVPDGVDVIIDATGSARAVQEALPCLKKGGTLMMFGICSPGENVIVPAYEMFENEWKIVGTKMLPHKMSTAVAMLESGVIDSETIVSRALGLHEIKDGLEWLIEEPDRGLKFYVDPWLGE
jgi:L-iditol 2-dehydrogenase